MFRIKFQLISRSLFPPYPELENSLSITFNLLCHLIMLLSFIYEHLCDQAVHARVHHTATRTFSPIYFH